MKVAIVGSRDAAPAAARLILKHLPADTTEIVSGGARGIDALAESVATSLSLPVKVFLPDYETFGRQAPLFRNRQIVEYADCVLAFWDGVSTGTKSVIGMCMDTGKPLQVISLKPKTE